MLFHNTTMYTQSRHALLRLYNVSLSKLIFSSVISLTGPIMMSTVAVNFFRYCWCVLKVVARDDWDRNLKLLWVVFVDYRDGRLREPQRQQHKMFFKMNLKLIFHHQKHGCLLCCFKFSVVTAALKQSRQKSTTFFLISSFKETVWVKYKL